MLGVDGADRAVGRDDVDGLDLVAGQPVRAGEHSDSPAERQSRHADGRTRAGRNGASLVGNCGVDVDQLRAGADRRGAVAADAHVSEVAQVDHQGPRYVRAGSASGRPAGVIVSARPHRDRHVVVRREFQACRDVLGILGSEQRQRAGIVVAGIFDLFQAVVRRIGRAYELTAQVVGQRRPLRFARVSGGSRTAAARRRAAARRFFVAAADAAPGK